MSVRDDATPALASVAPPEMVCQQAAASGQGRCIQIGNVWVTTATNQALIAAALKARQIVNDDLPPTYELCSAKFHIDMMLPDDISDIVGRIVHVLRGEEGYLSYGEVIVESDKLTRYAIATACEGEEYPIDDLKVPRDQALAEGEALLAKISPPKPPAEPIKEPKPKKSKKDKRRK